MSFVRQLEAVRFHTDFQGLRIQRPVILGQAPYTEFRILPFCVEINSESDKCLFVNPHSIHIKRKMLVSDMWHILFSAENRRRLNTAMICRPSGHHQLSRVSLGAGECCQFSKNGRLLTGYYLV